MSLKLPSLSSAAASVALISAPFLFRLLWVSSCSGSYLPPSDVDLLEFPLNLEFLEAEFFLFGALGYGLDRVAPNLTRGGPLPAGARAANLDPATNDIILQFGLQEIGHLR